MPNDTPDLTVTCPDVAIVHAANEEGLEVTVELPGVNKEDIDLTVSKNGFCISASRADLKYDGCFQFLHEIKNEEATAKFDNGLLLLTAPFLEPLRGKKITVA